jgi:hypothetical protein
VRRAGFLHFPTNQESVPMIVDLPRTNHLRPNGLGGYIVRQSDLSAWSRCQLQKFYYDQARNDPEAPQPQALSATVYGSVVHYALQHMEQAMHEGRADALQLGLATFEFYWHPDNIELIAERVTEWLPRQTYGGLRERGRRVLKDHYDLLKSDDSYLLALEYQFAVPLHLGDVTHTLTGTIDRLSIRKHYSKPYVSLDDNKTGKQPTYLRYHMQGTAYAYASTLPEFWDGWADSGLEALEHFDDQDIGRLDAMFSSWGYRLHSGISSGDPLASRRFRWINLQELKMADGGWRNDRDYARLHLAIDAYLRGCEAGVYSVNTTGEICRYCPFRKTCGGLGLPDENAGQP